MNIFQYIVLGLFAAFVVIDHFGRRNAFPDVRFWRAMGVASFLLYYVIATYAPFLWDSWLGAHTVFDLSGLNIVLQVLIGFLVIEFGIYFWHRLMHSWDPLWRVTHQMHHAAERVDIWGAYYFHPIDMLG